MTDAELLTALIEGETRRPGLQKLSARLANDRQKLSNAAFLAHVKSVYTSPNIVVSDGALKRIVPNPDYLARRDR